MMFLDMFGSTGLDTVLEALKNTFEGPKAINPHLVILDNLQFMLSGQASNSLDRWDLMDRAISSLRSFCNTFPVHVILVVHPRKEIDDTLLCLASVSGTAKATQEADNVIILQKIGSQRFLDIRKNRFHGELGRVPIEFNIQARMVSEMKDSQKNTSMSSNTTQTSSIHNVPENNPKEYPVIDEFPKLLTLIEE